MNHRAVAAFAFALLLAPSSMSFAQVTSGEQFRIGELYQQVVALLKEIATLEAARSNSTEASAPSCGAIAGLFTDGALADACLVNSALPCNESSLKTQVKCTAGQWRSVQTPPAAPPAVTTAGCIRMADAQTTSGNNFCGDLYCPSNPRTQRYWCRAGMNPAAWYSSALPCTGLSCLI